MTDEEGLYRDFHVISHTHWDREWYLCFEKLRLRLVDLMDHLLDVFDQYPDYVFHLDAQTVCLEDYLEIRPYRKDRLEQLITDRKLLIGPWYVQNDFHLTSGESTIRNLLIGSAIALSFGNCEKVGYVPDQFGLISQLPQILKRFGITSAVFGRGYSFYRENSEGECTRENPLGGFTRIPQPAEFMWDSPDGSSVQTVHLPTWYNNAQRFSADPERAFRYLKYIDERLDPYCTTCSRLLMNGVDHLEAQEDLLPILKELQIRLGRNGSIRQSTLAQYVKNIFSHLEAAAIPHVAGELRYGHDLELLQGTLSSRRYLKALNSRCQTLLELELEPLYAMMAVHTGGKVKYPADEIHYLWKQLLRNHPHDSICGCSTDRVHQDDENRFLRILDAAEQLRENGMKALLDRIKRTGLDVKDYLLAVVNPLPYRRSELVTAEVQLPIDAGVKGFRMFAPDGEPVDYEIVASEKLNRMTLSPLNLPGQISVETLTIRFTADNIPPSGYSVYRISPDSSVQSVVSKVPTVDDRVQIENEWFLLESDTAGSIRLHDRENNRIIENLFAIEDAEDRGDSYSFLPGHGPVDLSGCRPDVILLEKNDYLQRLRLEYNLVLPEYYDKESMQPVGSIENRMVLEFTLTKNGPILDVSGTIQNNSKDHRLRLLIRTGIDCETNIAGQPFDCVERPRSPKNPALTKDPSQPVTGVVFLRKDRMQMSVFTDGVYDYEHFDDATGTLAFTWVRATGRIINDLYGVDDNGIAPSPEWAAPENQCLRNIPFHIGIRSGICNEADLMREQQAWMSPLLTAFDSVDPHKFMGGRPCVQTAELNEMFYTDPASDEVCLPLQSAGVHLTGDTMFSSHKQTEDRQGYVLRFFNPSEQPVKCSIENINGYRELTLNEEPSAEPVAGNYTGMVPAKRIVTVQLKT